jgi:hypothetical protein
MYNSNIRATANPCADQVCMLTRVCLHGEVGYWVAGDSFLPFLFIEKKFEKVVHTDTPDTTFVQLCQV